jgi:hypothetical protein
MLMNRKIRNINNFISAIFTGHSGIYWHTLYETLLRRQQKKKQFLFSGFRFQILKKFLFPLRVHWKVFPFLMKRKAGVMMEMKIFL